MSASEDVGPGLRDHYCFGCGRHNPVGLHLEFERAGDGVVASYTTRREDQGFPGMLHGGLLALLLDEAMGWAMYADRIFAVTARMETRFRRPAVLGETVTARGRITRNRGRRIEVAGEVLDAGGASLVEASGLFLRMRPDAEASALATFQSEFGSDAAWRDA